MQLEKILINDLIPLENNVRRHSEVQIKELKRSINQFGQTRAIVIDDKNNVLIGNGLLIALKELNFSEVDCYRVTNLTEIQKKKLVLSDNKIFGLGSDDFNAIKDYIGEIVGFGDLDIAGFNEDVLKGMTQSFEQTMNEIQTQGMITDTSLTQPQPTQAPIPTPVVNNSAPTPNVVVEQNTELPKIQTQASVKTVICPSCGEVIYID